MRKFATVYGIVIGMAVVAFIIAFSRAPHPSAPPAGITSMTISSPSFQNNEFIPAKFSCQGANVSPELRVQGVPAGAKSLALIMHDLDAPVPGGFTHWVMWNIPASTTAIGEAGVPPVAMQGVNGSGKTGYTGPCPPTGHGVHHYHFKLYALDTTLTLPPTTKKADLENAMRGHILGEAELVGLYERK